MFALTPNEYIIKHKYVIYTSYNRFNFVTNVFIFIAFYIVWLDKLVILTIRFPIKFNVLANTKIVQTKPFSLKTVANIFSFLWEYSLNTYVYLIIKKLLFCFLYRWQHNSKGRILENTERHWNVSEVQISYNTKVKCYACKSA